MIEQAPPEPDTAMSHERPRVWVCTYEHRYGIDVWACRTEEVACRELAAVCREFWDEAREVDDTLLHGEEQKPLPPDPPAADRAAVELFFTAMNCADPPETYVIGIYAVLGIEDGGRR